ncbi:MAG: hypothetical protein RL404_727 [Pseudomonadota bacterium]|jgi:UDP:flavonoid glycosyltransferase YjiC (YdhE family)
MAKRILFIGNGVTLAHIGRPLVLAEAVDPARYSVHFACDARYRRWLGTFDGAWREIHTQDSASFLAAIARGEPPYSTASLCKETEEDLDLIDDIQPDLVVADFRLSMRIASSVRQVPYACITNTHWSPQFSGRYRLPDLPGLGLSRVVGARNAARLGEVFLPLMLRRFSWPMNRARRRFGLPALDAGIQQVYSAADHFIYAESEHYSPLSHPPSNHHYAGPIVWEPPVNLPAWWPDVPEGRPLVYVSMGSSGNVSVLPSIIQGLEGLEVTTVVSTAGACEVTDRPDTLFSADYLPASRVIDRASLVIGNGGSMMLHQALKAGVPMLAIPSNMDQQMCIAPFVACGAVRELRLASVTPASVRAAASAMLARPAYHQSSDATAQRLRACDPAQRFNQILATITGETCANVN